MGMTGAHVSTVALHAELFLDKGKELRAVLLVRNVVQVVQASLCIRGR